MTFAESTFPSPTAAKEEKKASPGLYVGEDTPTLSVQYFSSHWRRKPAKYGSCFLVSSPDLVSNLSFENHRLSKE